MQFLIFEEATATTTTTATTTFFHHGASNNFGGRSIFILLLALSTQRFDFTLEKSFEGGDKSENSSISNFEDSSLSPNSPSSLLES